MRPLIRRTPDGRKVAVPSTPRQPVPQPPEQSTNGHDGGPEQTTPQGRERRVKLDPDDVRAIRADYAAGRWDQADLAYIYGVTQSTISAAISGKTWRDVTDTPREQDS
ncbi:hypothetical protein [Mycolicibacterium alvei]|uniref:Uncharacterized protein n=1 Tax=Mycolicibacterium alvei TaxID=67081 RepID=A0A6N4UW93_9MYCO|nr:hypothetical protein [Mycolicibacterium alvei]MCV7002112.1 hypothetical protein [Mycolicibacterium alvei]BBX27947.1 hypothetical protein MALV_30720 [Mycolicibacterium alvei]